eukprot:m51a1_g4725 hypothetical protein (253) ;mRNA; f:330730-331895
MAAASAPELYEGKDPAYHLPRPGLVKRVLDLAFACRTAVYVERGDKPVLDGAPINWDAWLFDSKASCSSDMLYLVDEADNAYCDPTHPLWCAIKTMLGDRGVICTAVCGKTLGGTVIQPSSCNFNWGAELDLADISFAEEDCCALVQHLGFDRELIKPVGHAVFVRTGGSAGFDTVRLLCTVDRRESVSRSELMRRGFETELKIALRAELLKVSQTQSIIVFASHFIHIIVRIKMWAAGRPVGIAVAPTFKD